MFFQMTKSPNIISQGEIFQRSQSQRFDLDISYLLKQNVLFASLIMCSNFMKLFSILLILPKKIFLISLIFVLTQRCLCKTMNRTFYSYLLANSLPFLILIYPGPLGIPLPVPASYKLFKLLTKLEVKPTIGNNSRNSRDTRI